MANKQKIIAFPRELRSKADDKMPHVCFSLTGKQAEQITEEVDRIHLFIPAGFQVSDGANFNSIDLGMLNAAKKVRERDAGVKPSEVFEGEDKTVMALKAIEGITGDVGGAGALGAYEAGLAFNPQTALAFEGINLRQFGFAFTLVPESKEEAEDAAEQQVNIQKSFAESYVNDYLKQRLIYLNSLTRYHKYYIPSKVSSQIINDVKTAKSCLNTNLNFLDEKCLLTKELKKSLIKAVFVGEYLNA